MNGMMSKFYVLTGVAVIVMGASITWISLDVLLDLLRSPQSQGFLEEVFTWLVSMEENMTEQISHPLTIAGAKLLVILIFAFIALKLVGVGVALIRSGVSIMRHAFIHEREHHHKAE
mgnify:FL=1